MAEGISLIRGDMTHDVTKGIYPKAQMLYPSEYLYPSEDLYPGNSSSGCTVVKWLINST